MKKVTQDNDVLKKGINAFHKKMEEMKSQCSKSEELEREVRMLKSHNEMLQRQNVML